LYAGLEDARAGRGRLFLVTGEPGIGKTRLADQVAIHAAESAMAVLRAGCWEGGGAPAYWPFIQLIRAAMSGLDRDAQLQPSGSEKARRIGQDLAQLLPELLPSAAAPTDIVVQPPLESEQARFRLFDAVATQIRNLASLKPLILVLEDLHDADQPSLLMLRFVARQLKDAPFLVLGTYRDVGVQRSPALSQLIGDLMREGAHVPLFAMSRQDAARMIEERAGAPSSPRFVSDIYHATGGNPLFIDGLVRVLAAEGRLRGARRLNLAAFKVPDGMREAIRRGLALLSDRSALVCAAIIGQQFDLSCLQRATQMPSPQLVDMRF
jgi:predicted ATPase